MEELIKFWYDNEKIWFNCSLEEDIKIKNKYENYLIKYKDYQTDDLFDNLGLILLYDQIIRHIFRNKEIPDEYNKIGFNITKKLIETNNIFQLEPKYFIFALMPYRHTFEKKYILEVLESIEKHFIKYPNDKYLQRFQRSTNISLSKLTFIYTK